MLEGLRSFFRRTSKVPATRRFDAAGGGVRWQNAPTFGPINSEVAASAHAVRRRAGYYARNNPWLGNGVSGLVNAMVGYGIRPTSRHPDAEVRKALQAAWARWAARRLPMIWRPPPGAACPPAWCK